MMESKGTFEGILKDILGEQLERRTDDPVWL